MGRNREYKERVGVTAYLEAEEFKALEEIRWRDHKDLTEVIRLSVLDYIKAHGAGNECFRLDEWQRDPTFQAVPTVFSANEHWTKYVDDCDKKERLKILKAVSFIKRYVDSRI